MKKIVSVFIVFTLLFSLSLAPIFGVDWTNTDSSNLQNAANRLIYNGFSAARLLYDIDSTLSTISSTVSTISSKLSYGDHSITYWVNSINSYMNPIYLRLQDILKASTDPAFNAITGLLGYPSTDSSTGVTSWNSYLRDLRESMTNVGSSNWNMYSNSHGQLFEGNPSSLPSDWYYIGEVNPNGVSGLNPKGWNYGTPLGNIALLLQFLNKNVANSYSYRWAADLTGYNNAQTYSLWTGDTLTTSSFTPSSATNGLYNWLSNIQAPVARLSYVLASDERIEAQEAAAANEEAVVDNFIDSSGSGAASTSDFSSVSDLSSGFKNNIATDASVSGIWNIFNSDNFGWFSQETADQLDTTSSGQRTLRSSGSFPTPLLDQQTEDILKYIGGDDND